jgi:RecB family endonuclease NucS
LLDIKELAADSLEVLGEKAFQEGHVDILIKEKTPIGLSRKIIAEVKSRQGTIRDIEQLKGYMGELGEECVSGVLIASTFSTEVLKTAPSMGIKPFVYSFHELNVEEEVFSFTQALAQLQLKRF